MKTSSAGCVWPHLYHQVAFQVRVSKRVSGVIVRIRCFWSHKTNAERQCACGISLNFGLRRNRQDLDSKLASLYRRDYVDPRWELIWIELLFISLCKEEGKNIPVGGDYKCFFLSLKYHLLWLLSFLDLKLLRLLWCNCFASGIRVFYRNLGKQQWCLSWKQWCSVHCSAGLGLSRARLSAPAAGQRWTATGRVCGACRGTFPATQSDCECAETRYTWTQLQWPVLHYSNNSLHLL